MTSLSVMCKTQMTDILTQVATSNEPRTSQYRDPCGLWLRGTERARDEGAIAHEHISKRVKTDTAVINVHVYVIIKS